MLLFLSILTAFLAIIVTFYKWKFQYWKKKNVPYIEPYIPFGNLPNPFQRKIPFPRAIRNLYAILRKMGAKHGGFYLFAQPIYLPVDLEYIKNIMTKDFQHFVDHGTYYDEKNDPLSAHLFAIGGKKWKNLRVKLSPTFTSGKMRVMFNTVVECGRIYEQMLEKIVENNTPIDIKDVVGRFTTDVIGSCAFGLECQTITDDNSPFRKYGRDLFKRSKLRSFLTGLAVTYPYIGRALGFKILPEDATSFFLNIVKTTVEYREKNDYRRNDFMQILIDLKNNTLDENIIEEHDGKSLTIKEIAAQCLVFFIGGFETSATLMSFALFELSRNQRMQDKLREEINVLAKHKDEITYDALAEMKYLQQVIDETLRMYPPVPFTSRQCVKDYKIPDTDTVIEEGTKCFISILGIHHDEEYYSEPEVFHPERFSDENKTTRHPYTFLPFGEGPRICIGERFAYMQTKVGMVVSLRRYRFTVDSKTQLPLEYDPSTVVTTAKGGIWLRVERI